MFYTKEIVEKIDNAIPQEVRDALKKFGWNELGIYEEVKKAIQSGKKVGGTIKKN